MNCHFLLKPPFLIHEISTINNKKIKNFSISRGEYNAFSWQNICQLKLGFWTFLAHFVSKFSTFWSL